MLSRSVICRGFAASIGALVGVAIGPVARVMCWSDVVAVAVVAGSAVVALSADGWLTVWSGVPIWPAVASASDGSVADVAAAALAVVDAGAGVVADRLSAGGV